MKKRTSIAGGLIAAGLLGGYLSYTCSRAIDHVAEYPETCTYQLLFRPWAWTIPLFAFLGILVRTLFSVRGNEPVMKTGKVLRHDMHMFFSHWFHVIAVGILLGSGLFLGPLGLKRWVYTPEASGFLLNLHFFGILMFTFGLCYYISDIFLKGTLFEHLPSSGDFNNAAMYYKSLLGTEKKREQEKYLPSQRLSFILWICIIGGILGTGGIKVVAHLWSLPPGLMEAVTALHDLFALLFAILLSIHVLLGSVVPWSWPLFRSMVTGYLGEDCARKNHSQWFHRLIKFPDG